ncbi:MAG TPA: alkaline phosphatase family protein [Kofleriaceae bacterium]|nr:alkaline phosphatase family protein [Kofleriaceae bacterium]
MRSAAVLLVMLAACGSDDGDTPPPPSCTDAPASCRSACGYGTGDLAADTIADVAPASMPVDTIVLVMQENRTFDHYFSSLTVPGQTVDGAAADATNPDPTRPGATISRFHQTALCFDNPAESWDDVHRELDGGALDGFTTESGREDPAGDPTGSRAMGYYDETDLPYDYALARAFAISDRHFSSVQANSWTNRLYYMAGTSYGVTSNVIPNQDDVHGAQLPNLFTRLTDAHVTWAFYVQDLPTLAILSETWAAHQDRVLGFEQFFTDAAAGRLPQVTVVEGSDMMGGVSPDEDPPADFQVGQAMVARIVGAVTASPQWPHAALFLSYDEQGGFYDHVVPPAACPPDDTLPIIGPGGVDGRFDQLGLRVPLVVVSPYAKRGHVSHQVTDHTSILRFVEARFGLPALTHRDANAVPPFDLFDFDHPDVSVPALPAAPLDEAGRAACAQKYPR